MSDRNTWNGLKHTLANSWPLLGDKDWVWNPLIPWLDGTISLLFEKSKAIDLKKRLGAIAHPAITLKDAWANFISSWRQKQKKLFLGRRYGKLQNATSFN